MRFGTWLHAERTGRALSQAALGAAIGVRPARIHQWEEGAGEPGPARFLLLCNVFRMTDAEVIDALRGFIVSPGQVPSSGDESHEDDEL
jgi:transcriptional regulator with XRE-family HTH domain